MWPTPTGFAAATCDVTGILAARYLAVSRDEHLAHSLFLRHSPPEGSCGVSLFVDWESFQQHWDFVKRHDKVGLKRIKVERGFVALSDHLLECRFTTPGAHEPRPLYQNTSVSF